MVQYGTVQYSTVQYGMVQYSTESTEEPSVQRVKRSKGLNVIEVHSGSGHLKNISHQSLFPEEGPSCLFCNFPCVICSDITHEKTRLTSVSL